MPIVSVAKVINSKFIMIQKVLRLTAYWLRLRQCLAYQTVTFDYAKPPGVKRKTKPYVHYYAGYSVYVLRMTGKFSHWVEHVQPNFDYWKPIHIYRGESSQGRLRKSNLPHTAQHPILLPEYSQITLLLIDYVHRLHCHPGPQTTQNILHQEFWIV